MASYIYVASCLILGVTVESMSDTLPLGAVRSYSRHRELAYACSLPRETVMRSRKTLLVLVIGDFDASSSNIDHARARAWAWWTGALVGR